MRIFCLFSALAIFFFARVTFAAPPTAPPSAPTSTAPTPEAQAAEIKAQADAASDARHFDEAIYGYTRAYAIFPDPALLYNRSRAHEARGEYPEAFADLDAFANAASPELRKKIPRLSELLVQLGLKITTLQLTCNVDGARVLLNGRELGTTPLPPTKVNAGNGTLEVVADGKLPYKRDLVLTGGGSSAFDVALVTKGASGVLAIHATPSGASITVDGKPFGVAPAEGSVAMGTHSIVTHLDGYEDATARVVVESGARRSIDMTLPKKKTILSSPIFWSAVGVVVVGTAIVITVAALTEKSAGSGDGFTPGQVSGPLLKW